MEGLCVDEEICEIRENLWRIVNNLKIFNIILLLIHFVLFKVRDFY